MLCFSKYERDGKNVRIYVIHQLRQDFMKYSEVTENIGRLAANPPPRDEFINELLLAYGTPKATIARVKTGQANLTKESGEVLLTKKVWLKKVEQASRLPEYEPQTSSLPDGLREAHHQLNLAVDRICRTKPLASAEERLERLFKLYEEMSTKETLV